MVGVGAAAQQGWPWDLQAAQPTAWPAARAECWRIRSSGLSRAARTWPRRTSGPQQYNFMLRFSSPASSLQVQAKVVIARAQSLDYS